VYLFKVVDEVALLYGFITFRAIDHGMLTLKVCGAMSGDVALVGLLGKGCTWWFWEAYHCLCLGSIKLKAEGKE